MAIEVLDKKYEWIEFYRKTVFPHILGYEEKQTELNNDLKKFKECLFSFGRVMFCKIWKNVYT